MTDQSFYSDIRNCWKCASMKNHNFQFLIFTGKVCSFRILKRALQSLVRHSQIPFVLFHYLCVWRKILNVCVIWIISIKQYVLILKLLNFWLYSTLIKVFHLFLSNMDLFWKTGTVLKNRDNRRKAFVVEFIFNQVEILLFSTLLGSTADFYGTFLSFSKSSWF